MPGNFKREDLRIAKTYGALQESLLKLLEHNAFARLTVNDLCEEARISRPTFYAHFRDKYDLLSFCLSIISNRIKDGIGTDAAFAQIENEVNNIINDKAKIITNLMKDANKETLDLMHELMCSLLDAFLPKGADEDSDPKYIVFSHFCMGGMMKLLTWQIDNKFRSDLQVFGSYFFGFMTQLISWYKDQDN